MSVVMFSVPASLYQQIKTATCGLVLPLGKVDFKVSCYRSPLGTKFHAYTETTNAKELIRVSSLIKSVGGTPHIS